MKLTGAEINSLIELACSFKSERVTVSESISRWRGEYGHDRHHATYSDFSFFVMSIAATISGANLIVFGRDGQYSIALEKVTSFHFNDKEFLLEVTEQFEEQTERNTTISRFKSTSRHY